AQIVMSLKIPVTGCCIFALGSDTIFFEDLCQPRIDSDLSLLGVWRQIRPLLDARVTAFDFAHGDHNGRWAWLFCLECAALKRKFQLASLSLRCCALKLLPAQTDVEVPGKLLFQQLQSVQC